MIRDIVISIHEAGHATLSRVLRLPSGRATIDGSPCAYLKDDHNLGSLLTAMAGSAAERELIGLASDGGVDGDRPKVLQLIDALGVDSDTCWMVMRQLVRANEVAIRSVADALLERGELSGAQIDALLTSGSM
jgi:hypothetical protein